MELFSSIRHIFSELLSETEKHECHFHTLTKARPLLKWTRQAGGCQYVKRVRVVLKKRTPLPSFITWKDFGSLQLKAHNAPSWGFICVLLISIVTTQRSCTHLSAHTFHTTSCCIITVIAKESLLGVLNLAKWKKKYFTVYLLVSANAF